MTLGRLTEAIVHLFKAVRSVNNGIRQRVVRLLLIGVLLHTSNLTSLVLGNQQLIQSPVTVNHCMSSGIILVTLVRLHCINEVACLPLVRLVTNPQYSWSGMCGCESAFSVLYKCTVVLSLPPPLSPPPPPVPELWEPSVPGWLLRH